ncbi:MAG: hemerythrin domain-containing protein [Flavobacteriales bacterium]
MAMNSEYINSMKEWDLEDIVDHVKSTHHAYLKANFPVIVRLLEKLVAKYPNKYPELKEIHDIFVDFTDDLSRHLVKEEEILFPYFEKLGSYLNNPKAFEPAFFGSLQKPVQVMEEEHDDEHIVIEKVKKLSNNYTPPADADPSHKMLYFKLKEFEDDINIHHTIENEILFAKAEEAEKILKV